MTIEWQSYNFHLRFLAVAVSVLCLESEITQPGSVIELESNLLWLIFFFFFCSW